MFATLAAILAIQGHNVLSDAEVKAGWKLLFDGKSTQGWTNFKSKSIRRGWVVKDGVLKCERPLDAGDIVTTEKYDWFELSLEFNLEKGQNSGVMFHVADDGLATWHSGPEVQIYDHLASPGVEITGYLYQLYTSPIDAAKPAGEWNKMRLMISPEKCFTEINDKRYYEFVLNSPEFKAKIAASKFSKYEKFGKMGKGTIAIQGDHGVVSFRNIKIRPIKGK